MKILFICLGNICRSPMAEAILKAKLVQTDLSVEVDSAGLIDYHEGEMADSRMRRHAAWHGYDITHRSRPICQHDFFTFDWIVGMDEQNMRQLRALQPENSRAKLFLATDFCQNVVHQGCVPDPYYGGDAGFENVICLLEDVCCGMLAQLAEVIQN